MQHPRPESRFSQLGCQSSRFTGAIASLLHERGASAQDIPSRIGVVYDYEPDGIPCPRCQGDGTVDCHCGGDLCVCENYGERDCPICHGEGEVSEEREATYFENQRAAFEAMQRVFKDTPQ